MERQSLETILNVSAQDKSNRITITDEKGNSCRMLQESLITVLKVVTDADDNMVRILVTIG